MTLRDIEGFEAQSFYVFNAYVRDPEGLSGDSGEMSTTTRGPWSGASWKHGDIYGAFRSVPGTLTNELYFGFGVRVDTAFPKVVFQVADSSLAVLDGLFINAAGKLEVRRGGSSSTTVLATGTKTLSLNRWYYIEWRIRVDDTTGLTVVRVDEVEDINATGLDTKPGTSSQIAAWGIESSTSGNRGSDVRIDDVYVDDEQFHGDVAITSLLPSGAGSATQLSVVGAGANWDAVDEVPHDGDTSYVYGQTVNDRDLYQLANLGSEYTDVKAVKLQALSRKMEGGSAAVALGVKYDGNGDGTPDAEWWSSDLSITSGAYGIDEVLLTQQPDSTSWTRNKVNAMEIGVKVR